MNFVGTVHNMKPCEWTGYQKGGGWGGGRLALLRLLTGRGRLVRKIQIPITISNVFENSCSVVYLVFSSAHVVFDSLAIHRSQIPVRFIVTKNPRKSFL